MKRDIRNCDILPRFLKASKAKCFSLHFAVLQKYYEDEVLKIGVKIGPRFLPIKNFKKSGGEFLKRLLPDHFLLIYFLLVVP